MRARAFLLAAATAYASDCPATCSGYSCDDWYSYNGNSCAFEEEHYDCDCSGCACPGDSDDDPPPPAELTLRALDASAYPDARCLDGSPYKYYVRDGASPDFLLFFEGGGWCYDPHCPGPTASGTVADCADRARGDLGSSAGWARTREYGGMLSASAAANPVFHNWTVVYLPYCDGTSFAGDATTNGLHFKGAANLEAVLRDLARSTAVGVAPRVVVAGASAGASAVYFHIDSVAAALGSATTEVIGMPDAGFFLDLPAASDATDDCWPDQMRSIAALSNLTAHLNRACLARFADAPWKCMFPEYFADLISTRFFVINSLYDSSELW